MADRFIMPHQTARLVEGDQRVSRDWLSYLGGIETINSRVGMAAGLTDLAGGATLAEVIAQVNAITAALRGE